MVPLARPLRQLVVSPRQFFEENPPAETLPIAGGVVIAFAVALTLALLLVGSMLAGAVDATVTMDNPERPPDFVCEQHADDPDSAFSEGCDEPKTIECDAGKLIQEAVNDQLWIGLVAPFVLWAIGTIALFAGGRLAAGNPSFAGSAALAGWAALPEFARVIVGLAGLWYALDDLTISNLDGAPAVLEAALASVEPVLLVASVLTLLWQWSLLSAGLSEDADISRGAAAVAVGIPLLVFFVIGAS
ncbi:YIP1 family protein [Halobellus rufus]|uniref:YIP1 family protein n=1 Tax=Halobellus rufus TaxID=1448860 RepID=UPI00067964AB|nr:YIP1 family protein [Halobellus rufus]